MYSFICIYGLYVQLSSTKTNQKSAQLCTLDILTLQLLTSVVLDAATGTTVPIRYWYLISVGYQSNNKYRIIYFIQKLQKSRGVASSFCSQWSQTSDRLSDNPDALRNWSVCLQVVATDEGIHTATETSRNAAPHVEWRSGRDPFLPSHRVIWERLQPSAAKNTPHLRMIHPKWGAATSKARSAWLWRRWSIRAELHHCDSQWCSQNAEWVHLHAERECDAFKEWERSRAGGRAGRLRFHSHWSLSCRGLQRLLEVQRGAAIVDLLQHSSSK